jgi:hypothetical protein
MQKVDDRVKNRHDLVLKYFVQHLLYFLDFLYIRITLFQALVA